MSGRILGKDANSGLTIIYYTLIVRLVYIIVCKVNETIYMALYTFELILLPFEIMAIRLIASDISQIVNKIQDLSKYQTSNIAQLGNQRQGLNTPPMPNMDAKLPTTQNSVPMPDMNARPPGV